MLNNRNCQEIAEIASGIIGYSVLLTDNKGIVLGCSDKNRVGTFHEASIEVIQTGRQTYHDEEQAKAYQGTRPGTTIPIVLNDEIIGTIGITGRPEEISKFGILIRKLAEVFLKDQMELESARLLEQSNQNLLREIVTYDASTMEEDVILNHARVLGYNLLLPRAAVLIEISRHGESPPDEPKNPMMLDRQHRERIVLIQRVFHHRQDICVSLGDEKYIVFADLSHRNEGEWIVWLKNKANDLQALLEKNGLSAWIAIGSKAETIPELKDSYNDANQTIHIAKQRMKSGVLHVDDVYLEKLVLNIPHHNFKRLYENVIGPLNRLKNGDEYIEMVVYWCESKFNFAQTAKRLNIHKNTLAYRFERFEAVTGVSLYDFHKAIAIYLVIMYHHLIRGRLA